MTAFKGNTQRTKEMIMGQGAGFTMWDYSGEKSNVSINIGAITAVSLPGTLSDWVAFRLGVNNITLGTFNKEQMDVFDTVITNDLPGDVNAQRERKWLVLYEDSTQYFDAPVNAIPNAGYLKKFTIDVPTADFSGGRLKPHSDEADFAETSIAAFQTSFEQIARSPYGGRCRIIGMTAVGRNL
jgi:hypothetical protein